MSNVVRWDVEEANQISYDQAQIHRSTSETGSYSQLATQAITDNTYNDETGTSVNWYKIRFANSSSGETSSFSNALQADTFLGYCSVKDVRDMTNIGTDDLTDTEVMNVIQQAIKQVNRDINSTVLREEVIPIDNFRTNDIDGSNTTFYVQNWNGRYISDRNDDGQVTTTDVVVTYIASDGTETTQTVSSVTSDGGQFVMATAPSSGVRVLVTYNWAARDPSVPDSQINLVCTLLSAAYCYAKINIGRAPRVEFGNTKIFRHMDSYSHFMDRYNIEVVKVNTGAGSGMVTFADNPWNI